MYAVLKTLELHRRGNDNQSVEEILKRSGEYTSQLPQDNLLSDCEGIPVGMVPSYARCFDGENATMKVWNAEVYVLTEA